MNAVAKISAREFEILEKSRKIFAIAITVSVTALMKM